MTKPWGSADVIGTFVGSAVMLSTFVALEVYLGERACLVPRLMKMKTVAFRMAYQTLVQPISCVNRYQVMAGIGCGLSMQLAVMVGQAVVDPVDISFISSMALFFQTIGGAVSVSVAQVIFTNKLIKALERNVPGLDPRLVISTGATELRRTIESDQLHGTMKSHMEGLKDTYALAVALAGAAVVVGALSVMFDRRRLHKGAKPVVR